MQDTSTECVTYKPHKPVEIEQEKEIKGEKKGKGWKDFAKFLGLNTHNYRELADLLIPGNLKLPRTTAIFNMGSATECPSWALGLCQAKVNGKRVCYAMKAEHKMYPFVLPFRRRQAAYWKKVTAEEFVLAFLTYNALKPVAFTALRLNEASDFHTQDCLNKAEKIARILKQYGIVVYCYSARKDLDFSKVTALKVTGSGWTNQYVKSEFRIIMKGEKKPKGFGMCAGNCRICKRCLKGGLKTAVLVH